MAITLTDASKGNYPPSNLTDSNTIALVKEWRNELDTFYERMQIFQSLGVDEIFMTLAGFSARMSGVRSQIVRNESRMMNAFRTKEIDPFIEECDRQFRVWSRFVSMQKFEYDVTRGI